MTDPSRLGFGLSQIVGQPRALRYRLLAVAYEAGITHYDVAPSYGGGFAEGVLGKFSSRRRDKLTITTKCGVRPPALRAVIASRLTRRVARVPSYGHFNPAEVRQDLQESLRRLRTDYVDYYLLHEVAAPEVTPELVDLLRELRTAGYIRHFGLATTASATLAIAGELRDIAQVQYSQHDGFDELGRIQLFLHRVMHRSQEIALALARNDRLRDQLAMEGIKGSAQQVAETLLRAALRDYPKGTILFSSKSVDRIRANAAVASDLHSTARDETLEAIIRQLA